MPRFPAPRRDPARLLTEWRPWKWPRLFAAQFGRAGHDVSRAAAVFVIASMLVFFVMLTIAVGRVLATAQSGAPVTPQAILSLAAPGDTPTDSPVATATPNPTVIPVPTATVDAQAAPTPAAPATATPVPVVVVTFSCAEIKAVPDNSGWYAAHICFSAPAGSNVHIEVYYCGLNAGADALNVIVPTDGAAQVYWNPHPLCGNPGPAELHVSGSDPQGDQLAAAITIQMA